MSLIGGPCEAFFEWGGVKRSEAESPPTQKRRSSVHWNETAARALVSGYGGPIVVWPGTSARQYLTPYKICVRMAHPGAFFKKTRVDQ